MVDLCAARQQGLDDPLVPPPTRGYQSSYSASILMVDISTFLQQSENFPLIALASSLCKIFVQVAGVSNS